MRRKTFTFLVVSLLVPVLLFAQKSEQQKLVDIFAKQLKSRDVAERVQAAQRLGEMKMPEGIETLVIALADKDTRVRAAAAGGLWDSASVAQQAIPALRKALADPEPSVIIRAAGALISMDVSPSDLADPLRLVLEKGDGLDRFLAARALIGIDPADKLAGPIIDHIRNSAPDAKGTGAFPNRDNFEAGSQALRRLTETQDRAVITPLMSRLGESASLTQPLLVALGAVRPRPDRWVETLLGLLSSANADVRETAVELLGKEKAAADVKVWGKPVSRLAADPQRNVRSETLRSLKEVRGLAIDAIDPVLLAVQKDTDAEIRANAAEAVGAILDAAFPIDTAVKAAAAKKAFPILVAAIEKDANMDVRAKAIESLDKLELDSDAVIDILVRVAVEQKNSNVRQEALRGLRDRGKNAASAEPKIAPLTKDSDEGVRTSAESAIQAMHSDRYTKKAVTTAAAVDPAARDKALETLREYQYKFTEEAYFSALNDVELEIVTAFLDAGMSPNHRFTNSSGAPALRVVLEAQEGCSAAIRPTAEDTKGIVRLLLARGADPNLADENRNTPLMSAAQNCDAEIIKILLAAKADMNAKNGSDSTAFEFGLWGTTDGAAALAAAGFRLSAEKAKMYREAYAADPKKLAFVKKATKTVKK